MSIVVKNGFEQVRKSSIVALGWIMGVGIPACNSGIPVLEAPFATADQESDSIPCNSVSSESSAGDDSACQTSLSIESTKGVILATIAVAPLKDLQAIFESGLNPPSCPTLSAELAGDNILDLSLDFGDGCQSSHFPPIEASGRLSGDFNAGTYSFDTVLTEVTVNSATIGGAIAGHVSMGGETSQFELQLNVALEKVSIVGSCSVALVNGMDTIWIDRAALSLSTPQGERYFAVLEDVEVVTCDNFGLVPRLGSVHLRMSNEAEGIELGTFEFTSESSQPSSPQNRSNNR